MGAQVFRLRGDGEEGAAMDDRKKPTSESLLNNILVGAIGVVLLLSALVAFIGMFGI